MKNLPKASSSQIEAENALLCTKGHELTDGDEFCVDCFNEIISRVPLHFIGIGFATGLLTVAGGYIFSGLVQPMHAAFVMALGVGFAVLGLGTAVIFKLSVAELQPLKQNKEKSVYSRSLCCQNCGSYLKSGECPQCTRRKRNRSDAIGLAWFPAVFLGSLAFIFTVNLFGNLAGMVVIIGACLPYLIYARLLDRQLPNFKHTPFRL